MFIGLLLGATTTGNATSLENDRIRADFDVHGLTAILDKSSGQSLRIANDGFSVVLDGQTLDSSAAPSIEKSAEHQRVYSFGDGHQAVRVIYELQPGWRFVSKQLAFSMTRPVRVQRIELFRGTLAGGHGHDLRTRSATFLRTTADATSGTGAFLTIQNPFLEWRLTDAQASAAYAPEMQWKPEYGPFESDRLCIGLYQLTGMRYPLHMVPEWKYVPGEVPPGPSLDWAEIAAMTDCERAFLLDRRERSVRVHVGWCENDYQIDVGTPQGRAEYKRIIDRAAALGCHDVLYAPANSQLSRLQDNTDAWGWENVLWLGLGQKIRKGEWDAHKDPLPPSVSEMLDYAKSKDVKLLAYVYPSLAFKQDPAWTAWAGPHPGGYRGADTGQRSFQDWLVDQFVTFQGKTSIGGVSFDHWFINYDTASSRYAQWYGCRRVLGELRRRIPDIVIDGRQQYQQFGAWTWLAGSYPHPTSTDEQPQSFRAFPDLHLDRVSADRQRFAAWWYRVENFCPPEILPGFLTHQTPRDDANGVMRRDRFRAKDWDYLGWRYSVISSIATAPMNHVINMIPARDADEYNAFADADRHWLRSWLDWTDKNAKVLRHVRPILTQPMLGRVDGTAAFDGDHGFVFLFNPNYRAMSADLLLDASIGLASGGQFALRQLYPDAQKGRIVAVASHGQKIAIPLPGTDAMVLEVAPLPATIHAPLLIGSTGTARITDGILDIEQITGEPGTASDLVVLLPAANPIRSVRVNGHSASFTQTGDRIAARVQFAGERFAHSQQIGSYDPQFNGDAVRGQVAIPARVFHQLAERRKQWPVSYNEEDLQATWLGPERLLLFVNVADPNDKMQVTLVIDGRPAPLRKAYSSIYPSAVERTFVGWYADVTALAPGTRHIFEATLPKLAPGQFQGLFFDNVEPQFTDQIAPGSRSR